MGAFDQFPASSLYGNLSGAISNLPPRNPGSILPISDDTAGNVQFDPRAGLLGMLGRAITAPRDAYAGLIAPGDEFSRAMDMASLVGTSAIAPQRASLISGLFPTESTGSGAEALASKVAPGYNPPAKPPRPIEADYPAGVPADAAGNITQDIEGRPLVADYVVGRNVVGQGEKALTPAELDAVATALAGDIPETVAGRAIGGDAGNLRQLYDPATGERSWAIRLNRGLAPAQADLTLAHETGHLIDELAGQIPADGIQRELDRVYNTMMTGRERTANLMRPANLGYGSADQPRELWAEAIRAYMADPNYLKTVAPNVAARIRQSVNANPRLRETIQFNAAGIPASPQSEDKLDNSSPPSDPAGAAASKSAMPRAIPSSRSSCWLLQ